MVVGGCGLFWVVMGGCGWLWVVADGCGWLWVVAFFSITHLHYQQVKVTVAVHYFQKHQRCSVKRGVLEKLANFIGKHLCWSLFIIKLQAFGPSTLLKRNSNIYFEEDLRMTASIFSL